MNHKYREITLDLHASWKGIEKPLLVVGTTAESLLGGGKKMNIKTQNFATRRLTSEMLRCLCKGSTKLEMKICTKCA